MCLDVFPSLRQLREESEKTEKEKEKANDVSHEFYLILYIRQSHLKNFMKMELKENIILVQIFLKIHALHLHNIYFHETFCLFKILTDM